MDNQHGRGDGQSCPDAEQLAEYVDGRLSPAAHQAMQVHLADCDRCLELVAEMVRASREPMAEVSGPSTALADDVPTPAVTARVLPLHRRRALIGVTAIAAAAAALFLAVRVQPTWWPWGSAVEEAQLAALQEATRSARPIAGRMSGFHHAAVVSPTRSVTARPSDNLPLLAAARAAEEAATDHPSDGTLHTWGVAQVLIGQWEAGVRTLEGVAAKRPSDAPLLNDLAAAYIARGEALGQADDFTRAVATAERARVANRDMIEPWFNQAIAYEALGEPAGAVEALKVVVARDQSSWREEAARRLADLEANHKP